MQAGYEQPSLCLTRGSEVCPDLPSGTPPYTTERCESCRLSIFERLQSSYFGYLAGSAAEWKAMKHLGIFIRPSDIPIDEYYAMIVMEQERPKSQEPLSLPESIEGFK